MVVGLARPLDPLPGQAVAAGVCGTAPLAGAGRRCPRGGGDQLPGHAEPSAATYRRLVLAGGGQQKQQQGLVTMLLSVLARRISQLQLALVLKKGRATMLMTLVLARKIGRWQLA